MGFKILKLKLFHFCQFTDLEYDLEEGMTRIFAENGKGKTNACRGLIYAFTSWFDPSWGDQGDLQKDDELIPGYAEVCFSYEDVLYRLRRYTIAGAKTPDVLYKDDEELVVKRQRVNNWLEEKLPVSLPVLAQLMWVRQDRLHWLLTSTASSINVFLGLIFDTKKLEKMRDHLKRVIDTIADLRDDFNERSGKYKQTLESLPDIDTLEKSQTALEQEVVSIKTQLESLKNSISLKQYSEKKYSLETDRDKIQKELNEIQSVLVSLPQQEFNQEELYKKAEELQKIKEKLYKVQSLIVDSGNKRKSLEQKKAELQTDDISKCQYCGAVLQDLETYKNNKASRVLNKPITYDEAMSDLENLIKNEIAGFEKAAKANSKLAKEQIKVQEELAGLKKDAEIDKKKKELTLRKASLDSSLKNLETSLQHLEELPKTDADKDQLQKDLIIAETELKNVNQSINQTKITQKVCQEGLIQCEKDKKEYERNHTIKKLFTRLRDVYGQSRAQARYISSKIDKINDSIDHYLKLSEMPFTLELDIKTHTFRYRMIDSDISHPAGMLSGAQSAAAALAIQMALIDTAYPELSLLIIDEADAALSPANKFIAARLYRTLTNNLNGSVLVISQSDEVSDDCDNVWELT